MAGLKSSLPLYLDRFRVATIRPTSGSAGSRPEATDALCYSQELVFRRALDDVVHDEDLHADLTNVRRTGQKSDPRNDDDSLMWIASGLPTNWTQLPVPRGWCSVLI